MQVTVEMTEEEYGIYNLFRRRMAEVQNEITRLRAEKNKLANAVVNGYEIELAQGQERVKIKNLEYAVAAICLAMDGLEGKE